MMGMGGSSYPPVVEPMSQVAVISPQFCVGYPVDLIISRKMMTLEDGTFGVTDVNGNMMFKVKDKVFSMHDRRVLLDAAGNPLLTFQQKFKTKLDILFANNTKEDMCDFRIEGSWFERSCVIYAGNTNHIIAQIRAGLSSSDNFMQELKKKCLPLIRAFLV